MRICKTEPNCELVARNPSTNPLRLPYLSITIFTIDFQSTFIVTRISHKLGRVVNSLDALAESPSWPQPFISLWYGNCVIPEYLYLPTFTNWSRVERIDHVGVSSCSQLRPTALLGLCDYLLHWKPIGHFYFGAHRISVIVEIQF